MRLLVTGGCGFIGANFVRAVKADVVVLDKLGYGSNLNNLKGVPHEFVKGDIADLDLVKSLVKRVDAVVNFAAETHVDRSIANPYPFLESNVKGVLNLLEAVKTYGVRLVHISTDEVYGEGGPYREEDRLKPSSPYAATKAAADLLCMAYYRTYGVDVVIVRPSNNFGPYQHPEKLIPKATIRALLGLKIPIYGSGRNRREWTYVLDTVRAIELVLHKGESGEIYNVSAKNEFENIEVVKKILRILGKDESLIEYVEDRPGHDWRYSVDTTKIRKLGWEPIYDFDRALEETVKWYVENKWVWEPLATEAVLHPTPWRLQWK